MSPGTMASTRTRPTTPSRRASTSLTPVSESELMVLSASRSVTNPMIELIKTTPRMTAASATPPVMSAITAEAPNKPTGALTN